MNFIPKFLRRKPAPSKAKSQSIASLGALLDSWARPLYPDERAMSVAAVYACVRLISDSVAGLPIEVKDNSDMRIQRHQSLRMLENPNSWQNGLNFRKMMTAQLCLRGNAYARIIRVGNRVTGLVPYESSHVSVIRDERTRRLVYTVSGGENETEVMQDDMFHIKTLSLDGICGLSILKLAKLAFDTAAEAEGFASSLFRNMMKPGGVLMMPENKVLTEEQYQDLKEKWNERSGPHNQHGTQILEDGMKYQTISITPEDAQFIESRRFQRSDIAMFFGVPLFMIGETEKVTSWGAGIEQQHIGFVQHTLKEYIDIWEAGLRTLYNDQVSFRHDLTDLNRGDTAARWSAYQMGLQWGVISPNEVRIKENMVPRDGGDVYYDPPNQGGGMEDNANETE